VEAIDPLLRAWRLEAVLFQFPPKFTYEADNRRYLDKLLTYFKDVHAAVEFRTPDLFFFHRKSHTPPRSLSCLFG
jgi:uncharacterized protein YecE (DUF72 family)